MDKILLMPPVAFIIILAVTWLISILAAYVACKPANVAEGSKTSYACGEDNFNNMAQPDFSQFFTFAFFFTLAHVAALIMATFPKGDFNVFIIAIMYLTGAAVGLLILLRSRSK